MTLGFPPRRVVVPIVAGGASVRALEWARLFKERFGAAVRLVHAIDFELPPYFSSGQMELMRQELRDSVLSASEYFRNEAARTLGFDAEVTIVERPAVEAILETARRVEADLIVMGTHGRTGAGRVWLGSVTERVLRGSQIPVLAVRETAPAARLSRILSPAAAGDVSRQALLYAASVAASARARLRVVHVVEAGAEPPPCSFVDDETKKKCETEEVQLHGNAGAIILDEVHEHKPDLIIMGAGRKSGALGTLFSSTAEIVMQRAEAPLLVVPMV